MIEFEPFQKIPRLFRDMVVTEKIDGTNAQVYVSEGGEVVAGSRKRWITPENDNYGFAAWVLEHRDELSTLGPGKHYGEWWGCGIQRRYGLDEKRFSLFNVKRWNEEPVPRCCNVVPVLHSGLFDLAMVRGVMEELRGRGSVASPGFMQPEGVVIYLPASNQLFKATLEKDEQPKSVGQIQMSKRMK